MTWTWPSHPTPAPIPMVGTDTFLVIRAARGAGTGLGDLSCPLATAAYGTRTAERLDVLREFRDLVLVQSAAGSRFVALYYRLSPPVAGFVANSRLASIAVRTLLTDPVICIVGATKDIWKTAEFEKRHY